MIVSLLAVVGATVIVGIFVFGRVVIIGGAMADGSEGLATIFDFTPWSAP